jgi:hypothetical protein
MGQLLGPKGQPISSRDFDNKKAPPPVLGEAFGTWAGRDVQFMQLPGGGLVQFDLSKLTTEDFRLMRDHYQVNASLAVLAFMQHQSDFHFVGKDKKAVDEVETQIRDKWTSLNRMLSQANWAGYSAAALNWENDVAGRRVVLDKIKDLVPEETRVNWKEVPGYVPPDRAHAGTIPPKFKIYDGIKHTPLPWPIPVENSLWYPLLMENGDHYGRKLLRPAFTSWFFSILVHLFANRYYERFGEPTPVGRAPFDEEVDVGGTKVRGNQYLLGVLRDLRNRSVVVLPNDRSPHGIGNQMEFDYEIEYLESQMRGADFERYLTRLDEEISIGLFTPILLLRTADVGSYNLGDAHLSTYHIMVSALNDDRAMYIDKYLSRRIVDFNMGVNAPDVKIVFRKPSTANQELLKELIVALIQKDKAKPDLEELGTMAGMTLTEVRQTVGTPDPAADPSTDTGGSGSGGSASGGEEAVATAKEIVTRVRQQVSKAFKDSTFGPNLKVNMGYKHKFERALAAHGVNLPQEKADNLYARMDNWLKDVVALGAEEFSTPESFVSLFARVLANEIADIFNGG